MKPDPHPPCCKMKHHLKGFKTAKYCMTKKTKTAVNKVHDHVLVILRTAYKIKTFLLNGSMNLVHKRPTSKKSTSCSGMYTTIGWQHNFDST